MTPIDQGVELLRQGYSIAAASTMAGCSRAKLYSIADAGGLLGSVEGVSRRMTKVEADKLNEAIRLSDTTLLSVRQICEQLGVRNFERNLRRIGKYRKQQKAMILQRKIAELKYQPKMSKARAARILDIDRATLAKHWDLV